MDQSQIEDCQEVFSYFHKHGTELVSVKELGTVLRAMGLNPTEAEVSKCQESLKDGGETMSFEVFLPIYQNFISKKDSKYEFEEMVDALRLFDGECTGFIPASELRHMLMALAEKLSEDEVDLILESMIDSEGRVNYENLVRHVMNGWEWN